MNRNALVTALAALVLVGCATTHVAGVSAADPLVVATTLPPVGEPVVRETPPPPDPVSAPVGTPISAELLRARLVAFVLEAEVTRGSVPMGAPMPSRSSRPGGRWRPTSTGSSPGAAGSEGEDVQVARGSLRAASTTRRLRRPSPALVTAVEERLLAHSPGGSQARFQWPLDKVTVTSRFGRRYHPIAHREKMHRESTSPLSATARRRRRWHRGALRLDAGLRLRVVDHGDGRMTPTATWREPWCWRGPRW
jgi:hypothetical protein